MKWVNEKELDRHKKLIGKKFKEIRRIVKGEKERKRVY